MVNRFYQTLKETWNVVKAHKKESALIALTIGLGLQRCGRTEYEYCGMVEQDSVKFETMKEKFWNNPIRLNYLTFYNLDGSSILMSDKFWNDLKFEYVTITEKDSSQKYYGSCNKKVGKYVVGLWQAKADSVLPEILKIKEEQKEQERQEKIKYGLRYLK